jgi:hypothetical protein
VLSMACRFCRIDFANLRTPFPRVSSINQFGFYLINVHKYIYFRIDITRNTAVISQRRDAPFGLMYNRPKAVQQNIHPTIPLKSNYTGINLSEIF